MPADREAAAKLAKMKIGERVRAEIKRPRSGAHHRRFWALCSMVANHHAELNTAEQVCDVLKLLTGHCDVVCMRSTGEVIRVPRSISFSAMSQDEFTDFYRKACDAVVEHLLPGVALREVQEEVLRLVA